MNSMTDQTLAPHPSWRLPYREYGNRIPKDTPHAVESLIALVCNYDDVEAYDILAAHRPDLTAAQLWEHVDLLCRLSGEVAEQEARRGHIGAYEVAIDEYRTALDEFADACIPVIGRAS